MVLTAPWVAACGYCIEDKIASVYDHALVSHAIAQRHQVVFFHLDGPVVPGAASSRALTALVESTPGVDRGTVRVATETLTLSFAFDPRRTRLVAVQSAVEKRLASKNLSLKPLRMIDSPAELKTVRQSQPL